MVLLFALIMCSIDEHVVKFKLSKVLRNLILTIMLNIYKNDLYSQFQNGFIFVTGFESVKLYWN